MSGVPRGAWCEGHEVESQFGFSNRTHQACREVTAAASWRCKCQLLWYKCGLHKHESTWKIDEGEGKNVGREKHFKSELGIDRPMPVSRKRVSCNEVVCIGMQPLANKRLRLDPDTALASRFPQWVSTPQQSIIANEPNG